MLNALQFFFQLLPHLLQAGDCLCEPQCIHIYMFRLVLDTGFGLRLARHSFRLARDRLRLARPLSGLTSCKLEIASLCDPQLQVAQNELRSTNHVAVRGRPPALVLVKL
jgi:hypothetical protein